MCGGFCGVWLPVLARSRWYWFGFVLPGVGEGEDAWHGCGEDCQAGRRGGQGRGRSGDVF